MDNRRTIARNGGGIRKDRPKIRFLKSRWGPFNSARQNEIRHFIRYFHPYVCTQPNRYQEPKLQGRRMQRNSERCSNQQIKDAEDTSIERDMVILFASDIGYAIHLTDQGVVRSNASREFEFRDASEDSWTLNNKLHPLASIRLTVTFKNSHVQQASRHRPLPSLG